MLGALESVGYQVGERVKCNPKLKQGIKDLLSLTWTNQVESNTNGKGTMTIVGNRGENIFYVGLDGGVEVSCRTCR